MEVGIGRVLAEYARSLAEWRRSRYQDDLRDRRNLQSADGLEAFAAFVAGLPDGDPRLLRLTELSLRGDAFDPGQRTAYELGRFRFYVPDATLDGMLDQLVVLAEADHREQGRFGGPQVAGDDPWDDEE